MGRTRLIRGNPDSPLAAPLREILTVVSGPVVLLGGEFGRIDGIESAFLYGSFAARLRGVDGPAPHDIDVMVVGAADVDAVYEACYARRGRRASSGQSDDPQLFGVQGWVGLPGHCALQPVYPGDWGVVLATSSLTKVNK